MHGLFGELGVGTVTHSSLQLGLGVTALLAGLAATFMLTGAGMVWVARAREIAPAASVEAREAITA